MKGEVNAETCLPWADVAQHDALLNASPSPAGTVHVAGPRKAPPFGCWSGCDNRQTYLHSSPQAERNPDVEARNRMRVPGELYDVSHEEDVRNDLVPLKSRVHDEAVSKICGIWSKSPRSDHAAAMK